jgi:hypothetical protein
MVTVVVPLDVVMVGVLQVDVRVPFVVFSWVIVDDVLVRVRVMTWLILCDRSTVASSVKPLTIVASDQSTRTPVAAALQAKAFPVGAFQTLDSVPVPVSVETIVALVKVLVTLPDPDLVHKTVGTPAATVHARVTVISVSAAVRSLSPCARLRNPLVPAVDPSLRASVVLSIDRLATLETDSFEVEVEDVDSDAFLPHPL